MRVSTFMAVPLLGALLALPAKAPAQLNISVQFGTRLGPEIGVFAYSPERYGDWRRNYRRWTPVTLYDVNGHYYRNAVRGARPVVVYRYNNEYFLPPQDDAWVRFDGRYNYGRRPVADDQSRVRPYEAVRVDARLGPEIGVVAYSPERAGDWRRNYRRWTPVTVYEWNGHYYTNGISGARPVAIYRYQDEYFLPPTDQEWVNFDKRYTYDRRPTPDDHARVRPLPF
jgi:hypothetical protein